MSLTETDIQTAIRLYLEDFGGYFDEKRQIYQIGDFLATKSELMENDRFLGYFSALVGQPTPEEYLEGLKQRRPGLGIRRRCEPDGKRHEIAGLHEKRESADFLYQLLADNFKVGWDKGLLRKEKIHVQMQKSPDECNYLS